MTAEALLADLQARGVVIEAAGERLRYRPRQAVPQELLAAMVACKAELIALLTGPLTIEPREERRTPGPLRRRSRYAHPWPDELPGLGRRSIGPFDPCGRCQTGSWVRFGRLVLCLACARENNRDDRREP
jgi:hypothetical protein